MRELKLINEIEIKTNFNTARIFSKHMSGHFFVLFDTAKQQRPINIHQIEIFMCGNGLLLTEMASLLKITGEPFGYFHYFHQKKLLN